MLYILTIASRGELYDKLLTNYWVPFIKMINKNYSNNVKIQLLFGNDVDVSFLDEIKDNIMICDTNEHIKLIFKKTVLALHSIRNENYDYILRSNLSSFWIMDNLMKIIDVLPERNVYAGPNNWNMFVSGCGFILSRDVVNYVLNYMYTDGRIGPELDDVEFGRIIRRRYNITNIEEYRGYNFMRHNAKPGDINVAKIWYIIEQNRTPYKEDELKRIQNTIENNNVYHIRIKTEDETDRINDIGLFKYLSDTFIKI